jgi:hypothetical protein
VTGHWDDEYRRTVHESVGSRTGSPLVGVGLAGLFLWNFILGFFILGNHAEEHYEACVSATQGRLVHINRSTFPTQIWCEVEGDAHAGALYSFWQSLGFSTVFVVLVLMVLYGVRMMVRNGKMTKALDAQCRNFHLDPRP